MPEAFGVELFHLLLQAGLSRRTPPCCSPEAQQRIRGLKDEGRSLRHIARVLNNEGLPTPTAQEKWDKSHVWRVLGTLYMQGHSG